MFRRSRNSLLAVAAVALVTGSIACESTAPESGPARVTVALTDAPSAMYDEATVEIGAVSLIPSDGPPIELTDAGGTHDLLELQDGVMVDLATLEIDPGHYLQLRLVVLSASVTLAEGYEFSDGTTSRDLAVPSGAQSGIKINLSTADGDNGSAGVEITPGESILVVDMDVSQNFVIQGNPDTPAGIQNVRFTPLLRASLHDVAGSISGAVTYPSATPDEEAELAEITADLNPGTSSVLEAMQTTMVTTSAGSDSTYTLWFLSPGTYDVSAAATIDAVEYTDGPQSVPVGDGEAVTGVDFSL